MRQAEAARDLRPTTVPACTRGDSRFALSLFAPRKCSSPAPCPEHRWKVDFEKNVVVSNFEVCMHVDKIYVKESDANIFVNLSSSFPVFSKNNRCDLLLARVVHDSVVYPALPFEASRVDEDGWG